MKNNKIRKILSRLLIAFGVIIAFEMLCFVGAGGILNEIDDAIVDIEGLERKNLLNNPPESVSDNTRFYLYQYHNLVGLKEHLKEYETNLDYWLISFFIFIALFILSLIARIYFRKGKEKQLPQG